MFDFQLEVPRRGTYTPDNPRTLDLGKQPTKVRGQINHRLAAESSNRQDELLSRDRARVFAVDEDIAERSAPQRDAGGDRKTHLDGLNRRGTKADGQRRERDGFFAPVDEVGAHEIFLVIPGL